MRLTFGTERTLVHPNVIKSQVYLCMQVLERDQIMNRFHEVTAELERALSGISFEKLDISDEVKEQVRYHPSDYFLNFCYLLQPRISFFQF